MRVLAVFKFILLSVGLIVLGVLAVMVMNADNPKSTNATFRTAEPSEWTSINGLDLLEAAQSDFHDNEANADSAPQQQVVAGWATKDLLGVVALQNAASMNGLAAINNDVIEMHSLQSNVVKAIQTNVPPTDNRPRRLLTLIALAICWFGAWSVGLVRQNTVAGVRTQVRGDSILYPPFTSPGSRRQSRAGRGDWCFVKCAADR